MVANEGTDVTFEQPPTMCTTREDPEPPEPSPTKNGGVPKLNLDKNLSEPPSIFNTIMDVIVFLLVSAGHIFQVSFRPSPMDGHTSDCHQIKSSHVQIAYKKIMLLIHSHLCVLLIGMFFKILPDFTF